MTNQNQNLNVSSKVQAVYCVGCSGSGKTTWAHQQDGKFAIVSRDDFRVNFMEDAGEEFSWAGWNWKNENVITEQVNEYVDHLIMQGSSIIFADTNLNKERLNQAMLAMQKSGYETSIQNFLHIPLETCVKQDLNRRHSVGRDVIQKQWEQALTNHPELLPFKRYVPDVNLPKTVLIDLDGTTATYYNEDGSTRRSPFEWDKVDQDLPVKIVCDIVNGLHNDGYEIIFLSGRDGVCYHKTRAWLIDNIGYWTTLSHLHMRKEGDMRKDAIVKSEIFWEHIADKYAVVGAIDDRKSVLALWTDLGIKTIDVGNLYQRF